MTPYQQEVCDRIVERRRSLLITQMGMGSREVVAVAAARIARRDKVRVQVVDSRAVQGAWSRIFDREECDYSYLTPQYLVKLDGFVLEPEHSLTIVHLDNVSMFGGRSYTRVRDHLGYNRERWERDPAKAPRLIAVIHQGQELKRLPLIAHLFPIDATAIRMGDTVDDVPLSIYRDSYVKATTFKPWGTMTPGRGPLARSWAASEKEKK